MSKPITLSELAEIKAKDTFRLEQARKKLGVTQVFLAECIGMPPSSYNRIVNQGLPIPMEYLDKIANVLTGLYYVRQAREVLPVKYREDEKGVLLREIKEFLQEVYEPRISFDQIVTLKPDELLHGVIESHREKAEELLIRMENL